MTFYLGAKVGNVIVNYKLRTITVPSHLSQLELHEDVFYALFQVRTLITVANAMIQHKKETPVEIRPFPTLGTLDRHLAMVGRTLVKDSNVKKRQIKSPTRCCLLLPFGAIRR